MASLRRALLLRQAETLGCNKVRPLIEAMLHWPVWRSGRQVVRSISVHRHASNLIRPILHADRAGLQLHTISSAHRGGDVQGQRLRAAGGPAVPRCEVRLVFESAVRHAPALARTQSIGLTAAGVLAQAWRRAAGLPAASQGGSRSGPGAGVPLQGAARGAVGAAAAGPRQAVAECLGGRVRRHDAGRRLTKLVHVCCPAFWSAAQVGLLQHCIGHFG